MEKMRAKKSLGQNFLIDDSVLSRIVACVAPVPGDAILEAAGPSPSAWRRAERSFLPSSGTATCCRS